MYKNRNNVITQKQFWDLFITKHYNKNKNIAQNKYKIFAKLR